MRSNDLLSVKFCSPLLKYIYRQTRENIIRGRQRLALISIPYSTCTTSRDALNVRSMPSMAVLGRLTPTV